MPLNEYDSKQADAIGFLGGASLANIPVTSYASVSISKVTNGFIVNVNCKQFVAKEWKEVSEGLELYFNDPKEAEKKYCK